MTVETPGWMPEYSVLWLADCLITANQSEQRILDTHYKQKSPHGLPLINTEQDNNILYLECSRLDWIPQLLEEDQPRLLLTRMMRWIVEESRMKVECSMIPHHLIPAVLIPDNDKYSSYNPITSISPCHRQSWDCRTLIYTWCEPSSVNNSTVNNSDCVTLDQQLCHCSWILIK